MSHSEYYNCENGVIQGGVAASILFTVVPLQRLELQGVGCWGSHSGSAMSGMMVMLMT